MSVMGLDLGKNLGWVLGKTTGPMQRGTFPLANTTDLGLWLESSESFMLDKFRYATAIAVEQPFLGESYWPARKLLALLGHVHRYARIAGISSRMVKEIPIATGKLALAGSGKADKDMMIAAAASLGYEIDDEHQADALGCWYVYHFGERPAINKARSRSGPVKVIQP
jgi:Holliday junction resolvasome RuvABC endonuclease subunit